MGVIDTVMNGVVIMRFDDDNRLYTEWNLDGTIKTGPVAYTDEQNAAADARTAQYNITYNEAMLYDKARTALGLNDAWLARTTTPTNAQILAHIDRLTRENSAVIRILVRALDTVEGT